MQNSQLNRVISLIKKTGDKTIIMDSESDAVMMLMDLGLYEKMLDRPAGVEKLTEEELLEKINRDVAVWRAYNDQEQVENYEDVLEKSSNLKSASSIPPTVQEKAVMMERGREISVAPAEDGVITINKYPDINGGAMAGQVEQEQLAGDITTEEDEEKFYLEPVE